LIFIFLFVSIIASQFARCGVKGNLRKVIENTRKKHFSFQFFSNLVSRKKFAQHSDYRKIGNLASRTKIFFPLCDILQALQVIK
jgi:hypothetical protein